MFEGWTALGKFWQIGRIAIILLLGFEACFAAAGVPLENTPTHIRCTRITSTGFLAADGTPEATFDIGILSTYSGFIADNDQQRTFSAGSLGISANDLAAVSGQPIALFDAWRLNDSPQGRLLYFSRSAQTFTIQSNAYVILSVKTAPPLPEVRLMPYIRTGTGKVTKATELSVIRYTALRNTSREGTPLIFTESGILSATSGFAPKVSGSLHSAANLEVDFIHVSDITGKALIPVENWQIADVPPGRLSKFKRSKGIYWINQRPFYIVAGAGSGDDYPFETEKPTVSLYSPRPTITEGHRFAVCKLKLDRPTSHPVVVNMDFSGSAEPGRDYKTLREPVTIPEGGTTLTVRIPIIDDAVAEDRKSLSCTLRRGRDYWRNRFGGTTATTVIVDND